MKDSVPIGKPKLETQFSIKKETSENESGLELIVKNPEVMKNPKAKEHTEEKLEEEDDPWDKINERTINQYKQVQQKRKQLNFQMVAKYFKEEFVFDEADIDDDQIGNGQPQQET